jgi:hypothetical protein
MLDSRLRGNDVQGLSMLPLNSAMNHKKGSDSFEEYSENHSSSASGETDNVAQSEKLPGFSARQL